MTAALKAMVEAMGAEFRRQFEDDETDIASEFEPGKYRLDGCFDLEKVARAGLEAIKVMTPEMVDAAFSADPLACDVEDAQVVYPPSFAAAINSILGHDEAPLRAGESYTLATSEDFTVAGSDLTPLSATPLQCPQP